jgi:hypothetical protein
VRQSRSLSIRLLTPLPLLALQTGAALGPRASPCFAPTKQGMLCSSSPTLILISGLWQSCQVKSTRWSGTANFDRSLKSSSWLTASSTFTGSTRSAQVGRSWRLCTCSVGRRGQWRLSAQRKAGARVVLVGSCALQQGHSTVCSRLLRS